MGIKDIIAVYKTPENTYHIVDYDGKTQEEIANRYINNKHNLKEVNRYEEIFVKKTENPGETLKKVNQIVNESRENRKILTDKDFDGI